VNVRVVVAVVVSDVLVLTMRVNVSVVVVVVVSDVLVFSVSL